jgi:serine/threonine-protein kinase RsbW
VGVSNIAGGRPAPDDDPRVILEISSAVEVLKLVDQVSEQFARMAGLDDDAVFSFGVAVREAAVNAMKHGNAGDRRKRVHIEFAVRDDDGQPYVHVCVRDQGSGFDPACLPDPLASENVCVTSGRGIFLMRAFMDDVAVHRAANGGTEVVMRKAVKP